MAEPSTDLPDPAVFREVVEHCLRHFSAFMLETHMHKEHEMTLGDSYMPGEEFSLFDAGINDRTFGSRFIGMDCKTMVMAYRHETNINAIYFPMLRQPRLWRAIKNPREPGFTASSKRRMVIYQHAEAGQRLDHVVPSPLWPSVTTATKSAQLATALSTGSSVAECLEGDFEFCTEHTSRVPATQSTLRNDANRRELATVEYLRQAFAENPKSSFEIIDVQYRPYTCDFAFRHKDSGLVALVELKIGRCKVTTRTGHENEITVLHDHAYYESKLPYFVYSSGRWTYLLTSFEDGDLDTDGVRLPGPALLLHRYEIDWWHKAPDETGRLRGHFSKSKVVDLRAGIVEQIETILKQDVQNGRFGLPKLESFTLIPHERLADIFRKAAQQASGNVNTEDKSAGDTFRPNYRYQAAEALKCLRVCHKNAQGLIYDWQHQTTSLRTYAFCAYGWSDSDLRYTSTRPRRLPKEIFEHNAEQPFVLLSFCQLRQHDSEDEVYIHPFVLDKLKEDFQDNAYPVGRRLLILSTRDLGGDDSSDSPLYAIPDTAMQLDLPMRQNWTRFEKLRLRQNEDIERYRFDGLSTLLNQLASTLESQNEEETRALVLGHRLQLTFRYELYGWLKGLTDGESDNILEADQEAVPTLEGPDQDYTLF